jgi:hypothetical protein
MSQLERLRTAARSVGNEIVGERNAFFSFLSDTKWILALAIFMSVILYLPDQVRELYRVMYTDLDLIHLLSFYLQLIAISGAIWLGANQIVAESLLQNKPNSRRLLSFAIVFPASLATLPLAVCAVAQVIARPSLLTTIHLTDRVGSPWEHYGDEMTRVGYKLVTGSVVTAIIAIVFFFVTLALTKRMRNFSAPINQTYFSDYRFLALTIFLIIGLTALFNGFPVEIPQLLGVFGIIACFTVCIVAFTTHLSILTIDFRIPFIPIFLFFAIVWSLFNLNDNHSVRVKDPPTSVPKLTGTSAENFREWYESRSDHHIFKDAYPIYIVAAEGGGIYAAYQTATFLARMQDLCPAFARHLFAISSVSGGSLGSALFATALRAALLDAQVPNDALCPDVTRYLRTDFPISGKLDEIGEMERRIQTTLTNDFLSPLVGAALFSDFMQAFLPFKIPSFDRARSLELAFESAAQSLSPEPVSPLRSLEVAFESAANSLSPEPVTPLGKRFLDQWDARGNAPALIMNATDAGSGRRIIISPFPIVSADGVSPESVMRLQDLGRIDELKKGSPLSRIRMSTAVGISARFPWVTPAATLEVHEPKLGKANKIRVVDGGYADNSGVDTALDLIKSIQTLIDRKNEPSTASVQPAAGSQTDYKKISLNLIILSTGDYPVRSSFYLGEFLEPIRALLATRTARANVAINRASRELQTINIKELKKANSTFTLTVDRARLARVGNNYYELPLGWVISGKTREIISKQSGRFWDCSPSMTFHQDPKYPEADCVQLLISHELTQSLKEAGQKITRKAYVDSFLHLTPIKIVPRLNHNRLASWYNSYPSTRPKMRLMQSDALDAILDEWDAHPELSDERWLAYILASTANDTDNFRTRSERFSYSAPDQIQRRFNKRFPSVDSAREYVGEPEHLANAVYKNVNGNTADDDGWRSKID